MFDDVTNWLEELGLGEYACVFAENNVDLEVLPELTDADLKELGVTLGHRRKMLKAIRVFSQVAPAITAPPGNCSRRQHRSGHHRLRVQSRSMGAAPGRA